MTRNLERKESPPILTNGQDKHTPSPAARALPWTLFWRRPWLIPLAILLGSFLIWRVPDVVTLNPTGIPPLTLNPSEPLHHSLMLLHIAFGTISWIYVCIQLWPWLRKHHPAVHRASGRVYVFGGILPAAILALVLVPLSAWGAIAKVGMTFWAVLAIGVTIVGFRMARQRRYAEHRRWMLYSFALAMGVITGRLIAFMVLALPIGPEILAVTRGQVEGFWLGWIVNLALVYWWLRRTDKKSASRQPARVAG